MNPEILQKSRQRRGLMRGRNAAFTLIELMIAIAIFGGVMLAIYASWTAVLRSSKVGLTAAAEAQRTRMTLRALHEGLSSAELFTANIHHYSFVADTSGDFAAVSFVARLPDSFPGSGLFGDQAVRRVTFSVEPGPQSQPQLILRQSPLLEPIDATTQPYKIVLAPNVKVFQMEFLDTRTLEWLPEWVSTNQMPKVVKVAISFGSPDTPVRPDDVTVRTIPITSVAIPPQLQVPAIRRGMGVVPPVIPGGVPGAGGIVPNPRSGVKAPALPGQAGRRSGIPVYTPGQRDFIYRGGGYVPP